MSSFNKLANLHSVFFKKAANPDFNPRLPAYKSKEPTQGGSEPYEGRNGPLTPFTGDRYNQDQVRRQLGIQVGAGGVGKMLSHVASKGISGIPGGMAAAIPNVMAAGAAFKPDMPGLARKALNAPKPLKPVNLNAPNPEPIGTASYYTQHPRDIPNNAQDPFGGNPFPPKKLGRP